MSSEITRNQREFNLEVLIGTETRTLSIERNYLGWQFSVSSTMSASGRTPVVAMTDTEVSLLLEWMQERHQIGTRT